MSKLDKKTNLNPIEETYGVLNKAFNVFNQKLFSSKLGNILIVLQRHPNTMGYFAENRFYDVTDSNKRRKIHEIALNPDHFGEHPPIEIMKTLVHELCHAYQREYGTPSRKGWHNKEWGTLMESIGLMPSSTGRVGGKRTGQKMGEYVIEGGLFAEVYTELFPDGYSLKWYDYWVEVKKERRKPINQVVNNINRNYENGLVPTEDVVLRGSVVEISESNHEGDSRTDESGEKTLDAVINTQRIKEVVASKGNRVKYTCPTCKSNVWGKLGLVIICGVCDEAFLYNFK